MSQGKDFSASRQGLPFPVFPSPEGGLILYRLIQQDGCQAINRPMLRMINHELGQAVYFRPLCKSWTCPYCAPRRAWMWRKRAEYGSGVLVGTGGLDFVTVTSHEKLDAAASLAVLPHAWNKLNIRIKRAWDSPEYFAVPEQHQDGRWHLHVIVTARLKKKWWKDNARACGLGYQSDVQEVGDVGGVGNYVTKYLTKTLQNSNLPKGFRRVRLSRGWPSLPSREFGDWEFKKLGELDAVNDEIAYLRKTGFTVILADGSSSWDWVENMADSGILGD